MKDVDRVVKLFRENGFTLARWKNHPVWRCPCGHVQITTSNLKGSNRGRGDDNVLAQIKRESRICKIKLEESKP